MHPTSLLSTSSSVWAFLHWQTGPACGHPHLLWLSASMQMEETWSPCTDLSLDVVTSKQLVQQPQTPTPPKCCTLQLFRTHLGAYTSAVLVLKFVCVCGGGGHMVEKQGDWTALYSDWQALSLHVWQTVCAALGIIKGLIPFQWCCLASPVKARSQKSTLIARNLVTIWMINW